VAVVRGGAAPAVRLAATIADPPGAPALSIDADGSDRDGDGREDVALRVTLEGGGAPLEPGPRVSATVAWLDRPAGLSHDTATTSASFSALASLASTRAARTRDAPGVPGFAIQVRTLWRSVCAEVSAPRLLGVAGSGGAVTCGASRALEELGLAGVRAYATMGDALRAALAFDEAQRPPASRTASRAAEAQRWIGRIAPPSVARFVRAVSAVPDVAHGRAPAWGPLAFEATGKLLVRTTAGVVRVDPEEGDENAAADVEAWKYAVVSPDGTARWIEAYDPCDGLSLRASFTAGGGEDMRDVALPVAPALGGHCAGSRGALAQAIPVAWGTGGLEAIVEGEPVLVAPDLSRASGLATFLDQGWTRGSPRSPDGKTYVVPTSAGLLVRGPAGTRLLRATELDGSYAEQAGCAVSTDGLRVACVRDGKAWVGAWPPPSSP
jgi:hypothetical protein